MEHDLGLGKIINGAPERDAIHIAVAPIKAKYALVPGQHVGIDGTANKPIGVVDPFLKHRVEAGQTFWLFLYPNTVTSLRHHWTHPAFQNTTPRDVSESELWIRGLSQRCGRTYEELLETASDALDSGTLCFGSDNGPDADKVNLLVHGAAVLGRSPSSEIAEFSFRCRC